MSTELLIRAFEALEAELHHPERDSSCDQCRVMWDIEQHVGRRLTDNRGPDVEAIVNVRVCPKCKRALGPEPCPIASKDCPYIYS